MPAHALAPLHLLESGRTSLPSSWSRWLNALVRRTAGYSVELLSVRLDAGHELQFREAAGWTVLCRGGGVWITQEADSRDIFLKQGEGFALDRGGLALVRALSQATLSIRVPAGRRHIGSARQTTQSPGLDVAPPDDCADLAWLRSLYPESGPWNDPASFRRAGLL